MKSEIKLYISGVLSIQEYLLRTQSLTINVIHIKRS